MLGLNRDLYHPKQILVQYLVGIASRKAHIADLWLSFMVRSDLEGLYQQAYQI